MLSPDLLHALQLASIETRTDPITRLLYSTDASIYQIEPKGVVFPKNADELAAVVELAARFETPVLPRGSGSSLAGQAIGDALILDCARYLNRIVALDPEAQTAAVEPGVILSALNRAAAPRGLQFGPDPASADRATMGGSIGNNASGAHSIVYGMAADHLLAADVVLADGSLVAFKSMQLSVISDQLSVADDPLIADHCSLLTGIYRAALRIRSQYADAIRTHWPRTFRNASGYAINYLLPWSPARPPLWDTQHALPYPPFAPNTLNLTPLLAGSEGTLAVIRQATVRLMPLPRCTVLGVLSFDSLGKACDATPALLELGPSAVELIPQNLIRLARSIPAVAHQMSWLSGDPAALLVLEFSGDDPARLKAQAQALGDTLYSNGHVIIAETPAAQKQVWNVRKMGLGILQSRPGDVKPATFIEDMSVPVEHLGEFVREMDRIMAAHGTHGEFYAHASAGCLHMRPILNLKTPAGVAEMRAIAAEAAALLSRLGGTMTGEHGDGMARGEFIETMYGKEIVEAFRELKTAADPKGILNPGKIVDPPRMDTHLRQWAVAMPENWHPTLDFSRQEGVVGATELCNGAGVCRKAEGVMCPSFQALQDEMHSTRGRANLLRAMMVGSGQRSALSGRLSAEAAAYAALDLCLACKGCKAECPSAVDMAKLKYEFVNQYYRSHPRKLRDYLFSYIGVLAPLGAHFGPLTNRVMANPTLRRIAERIIGLAHQRPFPKFSPRPSPLGSRPSLPAPRPPLLLLSDTFNRYFFPKVERAAIEVLSMGHEVRMIPILGAGRTLISKGFLEPAKRHAARLVEAIYRLDPQGVLPIVGIEPSEIYTLKDEFLDLLPDDPRTVSLAERAFMVDEFLIRPGDDGTPRISTIANAQSKKQLPLPKVLLHGHCYQKAQPPSADGYPVGVTATVAALKAIGYTVEVIDDGCCGMAGAFGYEAEHYELSMKVGELAMLPAIRVAIDRESVIIIAAPGISCRSQIEDGAGIEPVHPVELLANHEPT